MDAGSACGVAACLSNKSVQRAAEGTCKDALDEHEQQEHGEILLHGKVDHGNAQHAADGVAPEVDLLHTAGLFDEDRRNGQCDDNREHLHHGELTQQAAIAPVIGGAEHTGTGCQVAHDIVHNVDGKDHQVILVVDEDLSGLGKAMLFLLGNCFAFLCGFAGVAAQFFLRQLFNCKAADGVDHQTNDCEDQSRSTPACGTAAELLHHTGNGKAHEDVGDDRKHKTEGAQLHTLIIVLGDQRHQRGIGNAVGSIEHCIQCRVHDEEVDILHGGAASRDGKQQKQAEGNTYLTKQHPRTCFAQLGVGAVDQGAKDHIADAVQNLGSQHQRANDGAVQTQCSGQIKQYKAGNQTIGAVRGQIAGTVGQLLIPFQIFFLCRCSSRHGNSPFKMCCIIHGDRMRLSLYIFSKALYNKAIGRTAFTECFCIVPIF